jgi:hypothetical protein
MRCSAGAVSVSPGSSVAGTPVGVGSGGAAVGVAAPVERLQASAAAIRSGSPAHRGTERAGDFAGTNRHLLRMEPQRAQRGTEIFFFPLCFSVLSVVDFCLY